MNIARRAGIITVLFAAVRAYAGEPTTETVSEVEISPATTASAPTADLPSGIGDFCFFAHLPPSNQKYKVIKNIKIGKGSYGSVTDILPKMAEYAQLRGADAIIDYSGSQRFGFWPWRVVRPVVRGVAVQWSDPKPVSCESIGGTKLTTIMSSGQPPAQ
jgi:hypothetical protein